MIGNGRVSGEWLTTRAMTAVQHIPPTSTSQQPPALECIQRESASATVVRWEISPSAIRVSPLPEIAAMNGQAQKIGRAVLEWRVTDHVASAQLRLEIGEDDVVVPLVESASACVVEEAGWTHTQVSESLLLTQQDGRVVYAKTNLLASLLGLPGGVYEAPAAP